LLHFIQQDWDEQFHQKKTPWAEYQTELNERQAAYRPIGNEPGGEMAVAAEAGTVLEDQGVIQAEDRAKVLALLVDHVPLDRYGEILGSDR
jgi:hypothetical protein